MAGIGEKAISILAGNLNSGRSYLITAVPGLKKSGKIGNFQLQESSKSFQN